MQLGPLPRVSMSDSCALPPPPPPARASRALELLLIASSAPMPVEVGAARLLAVRASKEAAALVGADDEEAQTVLWLCVY